MPETATRLPRSRTPRNPIWLDAIEVYKGSFDATSTDTLAEGAEAFAEMSPDDQAFHQAHLTFRQVQALGDIHVVLCRIEARLGGLDALAGLEGLPTMKKALVSIARGQNQLLRMVADGGLSEAVRGDNDEEEEEDDDDGDDDDGDDGDDDDGDLEEEDAAEVVEDEDHGTSDAVETVVPDLILLPGAPRPVREPS